MKKRKLISVALILLPLLTSTQKLPDIKIPEPKVEEVKIASSEDELIEALIMVESTDNDSAYCLKEDAVGCLQIRQIMVAEVNRIQEIRGKKLRFTLEDRWNRSKSKKMFRIFSRFYTKQFSAEEVARKWNGGPTGDRKSATKEYWNKVKNIFKRNK